MMEVNSEWRKKLLHETQIVNPNFVRKPVLSHSDV